ncbi:MAG: HWE histidine kinase domain-containing protein, partial [Sphingomicrobium sp.]
FNAEGVARVLDQRLELAGIRRDGSEVPVELSITMVSREGGDMFVGFLRDLSERRRAEAQVELQLRESRLMLELSELAGRDASFEDALVATLDAICELAEWPVGHAFLVDDDDCNLRSTVWSTNAKQAAGALVEATAAIAFERGVGLPGQVLASGQPVWLSVLENERNFLRKGLGFASGFAFPVMSGGRCIAVLEFFSASPRQPEPALLQSARAIGAQVGRVHERRRAEELQALLLAELNHRAKNILAVVRAIAHLSFGSASDLATAQAIFDKRLDSIAKANEILHARSGQAALLGDIVTEALAGCAAPLDRMTRAGPDLCVDSSIAITVSLAVHELCTNAFKYGALSVAGGTVAMRWSEAADDDTRFDFEWVERGGPPAEKPSRSGFGMRILQRAMELETGGKAEVHYEPAGFRYRIGGARHRGAPDRAKAA